MSKEIFSVVEDKGSEKEIKMNKEFRQDEKIKGQDKKVKGDKKVKVIEKVKGVKKSNEIKKSDKNEIKKSDKKDVKVVDKNKGSKNSNNVKKGNMDKKSVKVSKGNKSTKIIKGGIKSKGEAKSGIFKGDKFNFDKLEADVLLAKNPKEFVHLMKSLLGSSSTGRKSFITKYWLSNGNGKRYSLVDIEKARKELNKKSK